MKGRPYQGHDYLCWSHAHGKAIRNGDWKLVRSDNASWELYNVVKDPIEGRSLAETYPGKVNALEKLFDSWQMNIKEE